MKQVFKSRLVATRGVTIAALRTEFVILDFVTACPGSPDKIVTVLSKWYSQDMAQQVPVIWKIKRC